MKRSRTVAIVAAALVAVAAIIWVASRGEDPSDQSASGSSSSSQNPTADSSSSAPVTSDYAPAPSEPALTDLPQQLEPVPLDETAEFGDEVSAELLELAAVVAEGDIPGEISGPAIRVTVALINGTNQPLSLDAVTVFLYFGADLTPAPQITDESDVVFRDALAPGQTAEAVYTFSVPEDQRENISVTVSHSPTSSVVVFNGPLT